MQGRLTTSIVLYGDIDPNDSTKWLDFYGGTIELIKSLNLTPNYLGVTGHSFKSGKIATINRVEKKLIKALNNGEEVVSLAIYSLPDDYRIAAFDYNVYISRTRQLGNPHLLATFSTDLFESLSQEKVISQLKQYIDFHSGQVFQLNNLESPQIYASKANSKSVFKSLKVIKEI